MQDGLVLEICCTTLWQVNKTILWLKKRMDLLLSVLTTENKKLKGTQRKLLGVTGVSFILIVVMVSQVCVCIQTTRVQKIRLVFPTDLHPQWPHQESSHRRGSLRAFNKLAGSRLSPPHLACWDLPDYNFLPFFLKNCIQYINIPERKWSC